MKLTTTTPDKLTQTQVNDISRVAALAFGQSEQAAAMLEDTKSHLAVADTVQYVTVESKLIALAMYRSCLWQYSH